MLIDLRQNGIHSFEEDIAMMRCGKALVVSLLKILLEAGDFNTGIARRC